jgi:hypothetical protein
MEIDFAMIDAKDSLLIGIDCERPANVHNAKVMAAAEAEYLNRLLALQEEIKAKYEHQLIENISVKGEPEGWDEGSPGDVQERELKAKLEKGTGILWYS